MLPLATARSRLLAPRLIGRHQLAALLATSVDFSVRLVLVELAGLAPPLATTRLVVSFSVSLAYTYPMHTRVVFRTREVPR